jgi:hypothetical protein
LETTWKEETMVCIKESEFAWREERIIMAIQTWPIMNTFPGYNILS